MSIGKALSLASVVLALVLFVAPTSASATTTITDNGAPLNDQVFEAQGKVRFETLGSGIECQLSSKLTVNGDTVELTEFSILFATTSCVFFGSVYSGCEFEQHPVTTNMPLVVDLLEHSATVTNSTFGAPGTIDTELKPRVGKTCNVTTNDYTLIHEPTSSVTLKLETNASGFIEGELVTGVVKVDTAAAATGTTTAGKHVTNSASVSGTLILIAKSNTYTLS